MTIPDAQCLAASPPEMLHAPSPFARFKVRYLATAIVVLFVACVIVISERQSRPSVQAIGVVLFLAIGLPLPVLAWMAGLRWRRLIGGRPLRTELLLAVVIVPVVLATYVDVLLLYVPLSYVAPGFVERHLLHNDLYEVHTVGQWALLMLIGVVMAPVLEETIFRGILLHRWAYRWGTMTGVVASSALFAALHGEWPGKFLFGIAMSLLYLRTGKLSLNIAAHALNNFVLIAPTLWSVLSPTHDAPETIASLRAQLPMVIPLAAATAAAFWAYRRYVWGTVSVRGLLRGRVPYSVNGVNG